MTELDEPKTQAAGLSVRAVGNEGPASEGLEGKVLVSAPRAGKEGCDRVRQITSTTECRWGGGDWGTPSEEEEVGSSQGKG